MALFVLVVLFVLMFFSCVPHHQHLLEDSLSWFYWISHMFKSILLLQDTSLCAFCQLASWWRIPSKPTGIGMPWYCRLLSALKCCICLSRFQAYSLLEAALVCMQGKWLALQQHSVVLDYETVECFFQQLAWRGGGRTWHIWERNLFCELQSHQWQSGH